MLYPQANQLLEFLTTDCLCALQAHPKLRVSYHGLLPLDGEDTHAYFAPIAQALRAHLATAPCVLTQSGTWRCIREVLLPSGAFSGPGGVALVDNTTLLACCGREYVAPEVLSDPRAHGLLRSLGIQAFGIEHLVGAMTHPTVKGCIEGRPGCWFESLYAALDAWRRAEQRAAPDETFAILNQLWEDAPILKRRGGGGDHSPRYGTP